MNKTDHVVEQRAYKNSMRQRHLLCIAVFARDLRYSKSAGFRSFICPRDGGNEGELNECLFHVLVSDAVFVTEMRNAALDSMWCKANNSNYLNLLIDMHVEKSVAIKHVGCLFSSNRRHEDAAPKS